MTENDTVHTQSTEVHIKVGTGVVRLGGGGVRLSVTLPLDWMVRGYVKSVRRFDEAAAASASNARDLCIALFEACNWLDSLGGRASLSGDTRVQALLFVRHRTHHQFAAAVYFDAAAGEWKWYPASNLPLPEDKKHMNTKLERWYVRHLAEKPVRDVLGHIETLVVALAPNADLT